MVSRVLSEHFRDDIEEGFSVCNICKTKLRSARLSNLKRHLKTIHQLDVGTKDVTVCNTKMRSGYNQHRKHNIIIDISLSRLFRSYLGLVTDDNVPLELLNSPNLRSIMDPICRSIRKNTGKKIELNADSCKKAFQLLAKDVKNSIKKELEHELLSIKVNTSNGLAHNTFIISAHFYKDDVIRSHTLGLVKLNSINSSKLTEEIIETLNKYDVELNQVVSITVDNDTDVCLSSITTTFENSLRVPLEEIHIQGCAARAAHLCCQDVTNNVEIKEYLNTCRDIIRFIDKSQCCREALELNEICVPQLDCESRWGSTHAMVCGLKSAKNILLNPDIIPKELIAKQFGISSSLWDFVDCFAEAMGPLQRTILRYQDENLHYGHFYAQWLKCKLSTECILQNNAANDNCLKYKIATIVLESMQQREISNECLHACLFLDPRFHRMLKPIQRTEAIRFLKKLWDKVSRLNPEDNIIGNNTATEVVADAEDELLDKFLSETIEHKPAVDSVMTYSKIECLQLPFMKSDTNVVMFWKEKKYIEPELYQLSSICFAVPPTQIIPYSLSATLKLLVESNRDCTNETLENILLIKLNSSSLTKNVLCSLPLFEIAKEDKSDVHNDPLLVYEEGPNSWPDLYGNSADMTDEDDSRANTFFNDHSNESKTESPKKPKLSLEYKTDINEISIKRENINNDDDTQLSNESNSTTAHQSSDDQSMEVPVEKIRTKIKRVKKRGGNNEIY